MFFHIFSVESWHFNKRNKLFFNKRTLRNIWNNTFTFDWFRRVYKSAYMFYSMFSLSFRGSFVVPLRWSRTLSNIYNEMGQSIQEWTTWNLWKTAFEGNAKEMVCLSRPYPFNFFYRLSSKNFTWSILEYFAPNVFWK